MDEVKRLAAELNAYGAFDAIRHNAGVYQAPARDILSVNVLAPYVLTCLVRKAHRLIYLSSGMHLHGNAQPDKLLNNTGATYSDSKLYVLMLALAVARKWPGVHANAVDPGWVPTKMGGAGAPDNLQKGYETQVWLAASHEAAAINGQYLFHKKTSRHHPQAGDVLLQERLLYVCGEVTGVDFDPV